MEQTRVDQKKNPRDEAGFFSIVFFWWMNPLLALGYNRDLELEDLFRPRKEDESEVPLSFDDKKSFNNYFQVLGDSLEKEWEKEVRGARKEGDSPKKDAKETSPSLFKAMLRCFGPRYALLGIFTFFEECILRIYQPLFMGENLIVHQNI